MESLQEESFGGWVVLGALVRFEVEVVGDQVNYPRICVCLFVCLLPENRTQRRRFISQKYVWDFCLHKLPCSQRAAPHSGSSFQWVEEAGVSWV